MLPTLWHLEAGKKKNKKRSFFNEANPQGKSQFAIFTCYSNSLPKSLARAQLTKDGKVSDFAALLAKGARER